MNWKAWTPLAIAVVLGLVAARLAMNVIHTAGSEQAQTANFTSIVVAAHDIDAGATLTELDVATGKVDQASVPTGAFVNTADALNKVTKIALAKGQPIMPTVLAEDGAGTGMAATLPKGYRAITIEINDTTGVGGFIQPQCKVDIVTTLQGDGKPTTRTLLEGVTVIAVGGRTSAGQPAADPAKTVTLMVKPEDAEKIELAGTTSRLRMVLRNGRDTSVSTGHGMTIADLKGDDKNNGDPFAAPGAQDVSLNSGPTTQPSGRQSWTVEIIRAGAQSTQTFQLPAKPAPQADSKPSPVISDIHNNPGE